MATRAPKVVLGESYETKYKVGEKEYTLKLSTPFKVITVNKKSYRMAGFEWEKLRKLLVQEKFDLAAEWWSKTFKTPRARSQTLMSDILKAIKG